LNQFLSSNESWIRTHIIADNFEGSGELNWETLDCGFFADKRGGFGIGH
jgi:hypothetical protein